MDKKQSDAIARMLISNIAELFRDNINYIKSEEYKKTDLKSITRPHLLAIQECCLYGAIKVKEWSNK